MTRVIDEREHRRGLVLGLTLAEIMLLLLFLLLLGLGSLISQERERADIQQRRADDLQQRLAQALAESENIQKVVEELKRALEASGDSRQSVAQRIEELVRRLRQMTTLERELREIKSERSKLQQRIVELETKLSDAMPSDPKLVAAMEMARTIDLNDPPAALLKSVELLKKLGNKFSDEDLKKAAELASKNAELEASLRSKEEELKKAQAERDNLMRRSGGTVYPSCWTDGTGATQFIFDVTIRDRGIVVADIPQPDRANDPAWSRIRPFPRNELLSDSVFRGSTEELFKWSVEQKCRFFVKLRDQTGATSKSEYKKLRGLVEGHFYISIVSQ